MYCTACRGFVGVIVLNGNAEMRYMKLMRVDPQWLFSVCADKTHDERGLVSHAHYPVIGSVTNLPAAPFLPINSRSIRRGIVLEEPCPIAQHYVSEAQYPLPVRQFFENIGVTDINNFCVGLMENTSTKHEGVNKLKYSNALENAIENPTNELSQSNVMGVPYVNLTVPSSDLSEDIILCDCLDTIPNEIESEVVIDSTPQVVDRTIFSQRNIHSNVPVLNENELASYLRDQPSTSHDTYDPEIEAVIEVNTFAKRKRNVSCSDISKRTKTSRASINEHDYSKSVSELCLSCVLFK